MSGLLMGAGWLAGWLAGWQVAIDVVYGVQVGRVGRRGAMIVERGMEKGCSPTFTLCPPVCQ